MILYDEMLCLLGVQSYL